MSKGLPSATVEKVRGFRCRWDKDPTAYSALSADLDVVLDFAREEGRLQGRAEILANLQRLINQTAQTDLRTPAVNAQRCCYKLHACEPASFSTAAGAETLVYCTKHAREHWAHGNAPRLWHIIEGRWATEADFVEVT